MFVLIGVRVSRIWLRQVEENRLPSYIAVGYRPRSPENFRYSACHYHNRCIEYQVSILFALMGFN